MDHHALVVVLVAVDLLVQDVQEILVLLRAQAMVQIPMGRLEVKDMAQAIQTQVVVEAMVMADTQTLELLVVNLAHLHTRVDLLVELLIEPVVAVMVFAKLHVVATAQAAHPAAKVVAVQLATHPARLHVELHVHLGVEVVCAHLHVLQDALVGVITLAVMAAHHVLAALHPVKAIVQMLVLDVVPAEAPVVAATDAQAAAGVIPTVVVDAREIVLADVLLSALLALVVQADVVPVKAVGQGVPDVQGLAQAVLDALTALDVVLVVDVQVVALGAQAHAMAVEITVHLPVVAALITVVVIVDQVVIKDVQVHVKDVQAAQKAVQMDVYQHVVEPVQMDVVLSV